MITEERYQRIQRLFEEAASRPDAERAGYLSEHCGDDSALRAEVESLLALDSDASSFLRAPTAAPLRELVQPRSVAADDAPQPGQAIGPYALEREIARGGMGSVWLARRADGQFEKRVALKLIKRGLETDEILERFRHERQVLASLEHAHIARLYDGGATADGRPYLVMEYVEGRPLLEHCREAGLTVKARVELFERVCTAVEHAHQRRIVHRDLKPANILVTPAGEVKLLDFGIAKLLTPEHCPDVPCSDEPARTRAGHRPMTPEYASPEQFTGAPLTPAADVYALGVLLYELLVGVRPLTAPGQSLQALERAVLHQTPRKPSQQLASGEAGESAPTVTRRLQRELAGDLDTIVLKALQTEAGRRYPTAGALAEDLRRWLAGRPVLARPDSWRYRAGKFLRRRRLGTTAVAGIALLGILLLGLIYSQQQAARRHHAEIRDWVRQFRVSVRDLVQNTPHARWDYVLRRIDQQRDEVVRRFGDAAVQPAVDLARGEAFAAMGRPRTAEPYLREAQAAYAAELAALEATWLPASDALYDARCDLADVLGALADLWSDQGRFADAEGVAREAVLLTAAPPAERSEHGQALSRLGVVLQRKGDLPGAQQLLESALAVMPRAGGAALHARAESLAQLARVLHERGDLPRAEERWLEAAELTEALHGRDSPEFAARRLALAGLRHAQGRFEEADAEAAAAVALFERHIGPDSPAAASALREMAALLSEHQRHEPAAELIARAVAIQEEWLGPEHPELAVTLNVQAQLFATQGEYQRSRAAAERALAILEAAVGDDHLRTAEARVTLAYFLRNLQARAPEEEWRPALAEAGRQVERALETRRRLLGEQHELVASTLHDVAGYLMASDPGRLADAAELLAQADAIVSRLQPARPPLALLIRRDRARVASRLGRLQEARALFEDVVRQAEETLPPDHPQRPTHLSNLANCELELGDYAAARRHFEEAAALYANPRHPQALIARQGLIRALFELGQFAEAEREAAEVLAAYRAREQPFTFGIVNTSYWLGRACAALQRCDDAEPVLRAALAIESPGDRNIPLLRPKIQTELAACLLRRCTPASGLRPAPSTAEELLAEAEELLQAALASRLLAPVDYQPRAEALLRTIAVLRTAQPASAAAPE